MATKFCTSCGTPLEENVRFCTGCGIMLNTPVTETPVQPGIQPQDTVVTPDMPPVQAEPIPQAQAEPQPIPPVQAEPQPIPPVQAEPQPVPPVQAEPQLVPAVQAAPQPIPQAQAEPQPVPPVQAEPQPVPPVQAEPQPIPPVQAAPQPIPPVQAAPQPIPPVQAAPQPVPPVQTAPPRMAPAPVPAPYTPVNNYQTPAQAAPVYAQAAQPQTPGKESKYQPISTWGYIGIMFLMCIPIVGQILTIVWACGGCRKINKRNYARAMLILLLIGIVLSVVLYFVFSMLWRSMGFESLFEQLEGLSSLG